MNAGTNARIVARDGRTYPRDRAAHRGAIRESIVADPLQTNTAIAKRVNASRDLVIEIRRQIQDDQPTPSLYQVMPDLSDEDYAALKADIAARGVLVPVEYDERGNILDGHHRVRICRELGTTEWPRFVRKGLDDEGKRAHARALNLARRHLSREQRRELIAQQLKETPDQSDRQIAVALGVSHHTVAHERADLTLTGQIAQLERRKGKDGKLRRQPTERSSKAAKPTRTAYVSEDDAAAASALPAAKRDPVLNGRTSARQAVAAHAAEAMIGSLVADARVESDAPQSVEKTPDVISYEIQTALELLALAPVEPSKLHTIMPDYQWYRIENNLDAAISYLHAVKHAWRTS
jgi:ParB-like chromosome segregation protein Spo0J